MSKHLNIIMNHLRGLSIVAVLALACCLQQKCQAQEPNLTTTKSEGSGQNWLSGGISAGIWETNPPGTYNGTTPTVLLPVAGNTYEEVYNGTALGFGTGNTRLRNPTSSSASQTFPGDSLTIDANCEIRFKDQTPIGTAEGGVNLYVANFPGVNGNPGLILNGGTLNDGDNGIWLITGSMAVVGQGTNVSVLAPGGNFGNGGVGYTETLRSFIIGATMSGNGALALVLTPTNNPVYVTNGNNTFNGNWHIQEGWLIGTTPQCLGSASITVDPLSTNFMSDYPLLETQLETDNPSNPRNDNAASAYAILDFNYAAVCTGTLILTNGGLMNLHTNVIFGSLTIEGTTLTNGIYTYAYLTNLFTNFLAGGSGQITIATPVAPPAPIGISTLSGDTQEIISWSPATTATGYIVNRSTTNGGPYAPVGVTNGLNFIDSGLTDGQTYYYVVQATNAFGASTNSIQVSGTPQLPVANLRVTAINPGSVSLGWDSYTGVASYTVGRGTINGGPYATNGSGLTGTTYTDANAVNGELYYYVVTATLTGGGTSSQSAQVSALTYPSMPELTTDLYGTNGIFLELSTVDFVAPNYVLNVSTDGISFLPLATLLNPTNNYLDTGLTPGVEYYFNAQAQNSTGSSGITGIVSNNIPVGTISVAFVGALSSDTGGVAPTPPGYLPDNGFPYGDQGNFGTTPPIYGWATDTTFATGANMTGYFTYNANNPPGDLRYDSFVHETKLGGVAEPPPYNVWGITNVPNGLYQVRLVSGDATATDSTLQQNVNGVTTTAFQPGGVNINFAQWTILCQVTNNMVVVQPASTNNDKLNFLDIYPAALPTASFTLGPTDGTAPLTVNFTNISAGVYSSTLWTFGDGDTSASTNVIVSYTYTNSGTYSVSLIVSNSLGNFSTVTLTNAVTASAPITLTIGPGDGGNLQLSWTNVPGLLLQATNLLGPWVTNTGATSPFRVAPTNGQMYYRLEVP